MAITLGATKTSYCDSTPSGGSFSHTVDASTDVLVVFIDGWYAANPITNYVTGITWTATGASGQAMTAIAGDASDGGANWSDEQLAAFVLASPNIGTASGAGTISIAGTGVTFTGGVGHYAVNLIGVDTAVGTAGMRDSGSNSQDSGATISETITTVSGDLALAWGYSGDSNISPSAGQTSVLDDYACNTAYSSLSYKEATDTSTSVGYNGISGGSAVLALSFAPSAGGSIESGAGASTGTGAASGAGESTGAAAGASAGTGSAIAAGTGVYPATGGAAGSATASASGLLVAADSAAGSAIYNWDEELRRRQIAQEDADLLDIVEVLMLTGEI